MGREAVNLTISCTVSRHNSERDIRDDRLVDELVAEIMEVCRQKKYEPIRPDVW